MFGKLRVVSFDVITGPDSETFKPFLKVIISLKVLGAKKIFVEESFAKSDVSIALWPTNSNCWLTGSKIYSS